MALKAGYVGVLPDDAEKLGKLPGIESIGDGLSLTDGELAATGGGGGSSASIAPTFDSTAAYTVGDYVYYEGTLYRFTSNHAAGDWNSEEVTAATIGADLEANTAEIAKAYKTDDAAETTIDDADYMPFYDSSAGAKRKSLWSNIKTVLSNIFTLLSVIGTVENGESPTRSYSIGDYFVRNGKLGMCTNPVTTSSTWTLNTNYIETNIIDALTPKTRTFVVQGAENTIDFNIGSIDKYSLVGIAIINKEVNNGTPNATLMSDIKYVPVSFWRNLVNNSTNRLGRITITNSDYNSSGWVEIKDDSTITVYQKNTHETVGVYWVATWVALI